MEFKTILNRFVYRIEAKPGGGFTAIAKDSTLPPIEGTTREEVQQKIQDRIKADLANQFPFLQSALDTNNVKLHYHIDTKPGGGYIVHHGDPAHEPIEGSTREQLESLVESKIFSLIMERLPPELSQKLTDRLNSGGLDVIMDRNLRVRTDEHGRKQGLAQSNVFVVGDAAQSGGAFKPPAGSLDQPQAIAYERSKAGSIIRFLLAVAIAALLIYVLLHRR